MSIDLEKIGGFQILLKGDTSIGLVFRSLYEHILYLTKKEKSIKKVSANIYYTTKNDLIIKDNLKISAKYLEIDALFESLIKQVKENKTLETDTVINSKIYLNLFDGESSRFLLFNRSSKELLVEFHDKTKTNKHIEVKPIKGKDNCKAYIFSKDCDLDFIKKTSEKVFTDIESKIKGFDLINISTLKKILEEKEQEPEEVVEDVVDVEEEFEEIDEPEIDLVDEFEAPSKKTKHNDDDDPLSGDLDEEDYTRS